MNKLLTSNDTKYRWIRTIIQDVIAVIIANLDYIVGVFSWPTEIKLLVFGIVKAILVPTMRELGNRTPERLPEIPEDEDIPDAD